MHALVFLLKPVLPMLLRVVELELINNFLTQRYYG